MESQVELRDVIPSDLPVFFRQQQNDTAVHMAAFVSRDPKDRHVFDDHWSKMLADESVIIKTILHAGLVAGHIAKWVLANEPQITYWIAAEYWGMGIASKALGLFLQALDTRPLFASAAKDNHGSIRVLQKNRFEITGYQSAYAPARGMEIEEIFLRLD